ncbi:hypothetical protein ACFPYJ_10160 [Paenibacillus solisilvae]|uniref:Uncharacterized protein n=1 Tax=Paenibacillus solisilvae TaxID=2486751 RepID=A0ABW0VXS4_9BACL
MRKKWWITGGAFGVGAVMLLVSGFSAMASTSGYDAYKSALKHTKEVTNLTADMKLAVTDNGTELLAGNADIKWDRKLNSGSVAASFDNHTQMHALNLFRQDGKVIVKSADDEIYRVKELDAYKWQEEGSTPNPPKVVEQIFDALMGNIRELATVESASDGGKQAELHLSGSQIPAIANVLGTLAVSKLAENDQQHLSFPKLTDNIKVEEINLDAKINASNVLEKQAAEINIAGTDDSGVQHDLVIELQVDFRDLNQTVPERVDLTGKQIVEIKDEETKRGWHH